MEELMLGGMFITLFIGIFFFIMAISVVIYVLQSIGLYRMAERQGINNAWLAWIPIAMYYIIGELTTDNKEDKRGLKYLAVMGGFIVVSIIYSIYDLFAQVLFTGDSFAYLIVLGLYSIISIGLSIFTFVIYYQILKRYTTKKVLILIFGILTGGLVISIALFFIRNNPRLDNEGVIEVQPEDIETDSTLEQ